MRKCVLFLLIFVLASCGQEPSQTKLQDYPPVKKMIKIYRTLSFDPVKFVKIIGKGWSIMEQDERSLSLTEIDLNKVSLETYLKTGEKFIKGEEKLRREKQDKQIRLDAGILLTLWVKQDSIPESWKEKVNGKTKYIFFDGTILQRSDGRRYVLCLCWVNNKWRWSCYWLGNTFKTHDPSVLLANQS